MTYFRRILGIKWQDKVPDTKVAFFPLEHVYTLLMTAQT